MPGPVPFTQAREVDAVIIPAWQLSTPRLTEAVTLLAQDQSHTQVCTIQEPEQGVGRGCQVVREEGSKRMRPEL